MPADGLGFGRRELDTYSRFKVVHSSIERFHLHGNRSQFERQEILDNLPDIFNYAHATILAVEHRPVYGNSGVIDS